MHYWRSSNQQEVDFIIDDHTAIEVKATQRVTPRDLKRLQCLAEEKVFKQLYLVSQDGVEAKYGDIQCMHWQTFMKRLWTDEII